MITTAALIWLMIGLLAAAMCGKVCHSVDGRQLHWFAVVAIAVLWPLVAIWCVCIAIRTVNEMDEGRNRRWRL